MVVRVADDGGAADWRIDSANSFGPILKLTTVIVVIARSRLSFAAIPGTTNVILYVLLLVVRMTLLFCSGSCFPAAVSNVMYGRDYGPNCGPPVSHRSIAWW